jgi:hypothetical protein
MPANSQLVNGVFVGRVYFWGVLCGSFCGSSRFDRLVGRGYIGRYAKTAFETPIPVSEEAAYDFEWDAVKALANVRKHGVTFDQAATVVHARL